MDTELEDELGYSKYDDRNKQTGNSCNGHYRKTVASSRDQGARDCEGACEPAIVPEHEMDISATKDKILFLYSQGISTWDTEKVMQEIHVLEMDAGRVSRMTDKLLPTIWK